MVKAGLSPNEALVTATSNAAEALGLQASLGKLEQGYAADIIALAKDPLADIHELKKVVFVMRDGVVYKMQ
ncbi:MAG: imidazolonepropionase-like amidohydrolase [Gammaproteobacteria bacterium]